jgi:hypothetical protein
VRRWWQNRPSVSDGGSCRIAIVTRGACEVLDLKTQRQLLSFSTPANPQGVAAVAVQGSPGTDHASYLILPSSEREGSLVMYDLKTFEVAGVINAHKSPVVAVATSPDGQLLATASDRGTLVRVHTIPRGQEVGTFRRGTTKASIRVLSFLSPPALKPVRASVGTADDTSETTVSEARHSSSSASAPAVTVAGEAPVVPPTARFLAVGSDSATVHIFALGVLKPSAVMEAAGEIWSSVTGMFSTQRDALSRPPSEPSSSAPSSTPAPQLVQGSDDTAPALSSSVDSTSSAGSVVALRRRAAPIRAAVSEAVETGLMLGGVEGTRSFATLRRTAVGSGSKGSAVGALAIRRAHGGDFACGISPSVVGGKDQVTLEAVVVLESGEVLRYRIDGERGGEGELVGEGRLTLDEQEDEQS